ncbi:MAG: methionyl-tRNA formyltransferase, partial [Rikenellaceae bacterium]
MSGKDLRIVYMGTPDFAVEPLRRLVEGGYDVVAVVTMPDKPSGRGLKLKGSAVKEYAESVALPILQPEKLSNPAFVEELSSYAPDLGIVVAFKMLPTVIWSMPRLGTFNLHASLLPDYRGAAPINWAIMNGDKVSGITTFMLDKAIDTGDVLCKESVVIADDETAGTLHDKLMILGGDLVLKSVELIAAGDVVPVAQSEIK